MNWSEEMAHAYEVGLADGKAGYRRGRPNDFEGCYEQGWQHGKAARVAEALRAYDRAHELMRRQLIAEHETRRVARRVRR